MNCIDGIEGTLSYVLEGFRERWASGQDDDSEFVANLKTTIENACRFLNENSEIGVSGELLGRVLYEQSRRWWVDAVKRIQDGEEEDDAASRQDDGFNEYYFDILYSRGTYPD
ncbi:MAG: hypothetical protein JRI97_00765 [Deltaproteobacteria bacterium]|nr:hypothetical protein [Deltaproteobacteria bacterium]